MTQTRLSQPTRRSALGRIVLWIAGGMAAVAVAAILLAPSLIEWIAAGALTARGFGPARLTVVQASLTGFEARDVALAGGSARVGRVRLDYGFADLVNGRISSLRVEEADIALSWDGAALRLGGVELKVPTRRTAPPAETAAPGALPPPPGNTITVDAVMVANARVRLSMPDRTVAAATSLDLSRAETGGWQGTVDISVTGDGIDGALSWAGLVAGADLGAWRGDGALRASIAGLSVADAFAELSVELNAELAATDTATRLSGRFDRPLVLTLAPGLVQAVNGVLPGLAGDGRASFAIRGRTSAPFAAARSTMDDGERWSMDIAVDAALGAARARAVADGWFAGQDFAFPLISVDVADVPVAGGAVSGAIALKDNAGPLVMAGGAFTLDLSGRAIASDAVALPDGRLTGRGAWRLDGLSLSFEFDDLAATLTDAVLAQTARLPGPQTVSLAEPDPRRQVNVVFGNEVSIAADLDLAVPLSLLAPDDGAWTIDLPRLGLSGYATPGDGGFRTRFTSDAGKLAYGRSVAVLPDFDLTVADSGVTGRVDGRLIAAGAVSTTGALANRPDTSLMFRSSVRSRANALDVSGQLFTATEVPLGIFTVTRVAEGGLEVAVDVPELALGPGGTSWNDVAGSLLPIDRVDGRVAAAVRARIGPNGVAGTARLTLDTVGFDYGTIRVRDVAGTLVLDQLWPPRAATPQTLSFAAVEITPPLTGGQLIVALPGDGTAVVQEFTADMAGGRVAGGPAVLHLDGRPSTLTLSVTDARVDRLLAAAATEGLSGTGTISGQIPLRLRDGGLYVEQATLAGRNGTVAYRPAAAPAALASGGELVLQALTDFRFDEVRAEINGNALEDLSVAIKFKGKNPGLYGGYPIEFNLNLDGPLARIATDSLAGYRIPDEIRQRMEQDAIEHKGVNAGGGAAPPP